MGQYFLDTQYHEMHIFRCLFSGMRIRSDPLIFGLPDPLLFSPDPDPTCNSGYINLFSSLTKHKPVTINSSLKWWIIRSNFMPTNTYPKYEYIFFSFQIKVGSGFIFQLSRIGIQGNKMLNPHPWAFLRG